MAARFVSGGTLFTFGNGGSATDAASVAALFAAPPEGRPLPARNLAEDPAILTALGNDVGFDLVFSRQLDRHGASGDIALGISTSGGSGTCSGDEEARASGMLTVGLAGYGGGELAQSPDVDHCLVVEADSVHRIQETQDALACAVWWLCRTAWGGRSMLRRRRRDREAAVLDRIEAFRRRRPTLRDEVVTLAHGAGGKASAALVGDVFVKRVSAGPRGRCPMQRPSRSRAASGSRSAPTRSS